MLLYQIIIVKHPNSQISGIRLLLLLNVLFIWASLIWLSHGIRGQLLRGEVLKFPQEGTLL